MGDVVDGKFSCGACGKRYAWKPQLSGRRAKCLCGAEVVVPQAPRAAPAPASTEDDVYDVVDAPVAPRAASPTTVVPVAATAVAAQQAAHGARLTPLAAQQS